MELINQNHFSVTGIRISLCFLLASDDPTIFINLLLFACKQEKKFLFDWWKYCSYERYACIPVGYRGLF